MGINIFLDRAKIILDISKDAELARVLELRPQELNRARKEGQIKTEVLEKLAEITGFSLDDLLIAREATKAKGVTERAAWERVLQRVAMGVLGAAISVNQITPTTPEVYDFTGKTSTKDYRKLRNLFSFKALAVELSIICGTAARLLPRQPIRLFPIIH